MERDFFQWDDYAKEQEITFPSDAIEEIFLLDWEKGSVWLSKKLARLLYVDKEDVRSEISFQELKEFFVESGRKNFEQEIQRLVAGKVKRVNSHVAVIRKDTCLSAVCYVFRLQREGYLLGFLSIDYEPIQEYEKDRENVVRQMKHVQDVNDLVLEGAADYIYQFDMVNNVCTVSSKTMEILPIDSPTFSDAMSRLVSLVIPEDRQIYLDTWTPFLSGKSDYHKAKFRMLNRKGEIVWILSQGKGLRDEEGNPIIMAGSMVDITEQQKKEEKINQMLYFDSLTGLKNRLCFDKEMEDCLAESGAKGSFVYINIRKFKLFNEMFGRDFANKILQEFARRLELYFPGALGIYRFGGDEFLVHLKEYEHEAIMARIVPFQSSLRNHIVLEGRTIYINMYAAIVVYPENGSSARELVMHANQCLYRMSREEKDEIRFFMGQAGEDVTKQYILENELRKDVQNDFKHFRVVYQPIVHVENGKAKWEGAEALLRYSNPDMPNVGQMEMIQTLEYSGLIMQVGRWVLSQAIKECSKWNKAGNHVVVHVNMAAQQVTDAGLVEYIRSECDKAGLDYTSLIVELTETSLVNNFAMATQLCQSLMQMGVGVALDDFGTGYSGFTYLRHFPISQIKVDREYARDIPNNRYNQVIVSFMHNLSQNMNVDLCVEGVETEQELKVLVDMGVSTIQGFYFERPMEAEVIRKEFISQAVGKDE